MLDRRQWLKTFGVLALTSLDAARQVGAATRGRTYTQPFANGERVLVKYPGKRPLIRLTARPPQLETPFAVFDESLITPNDAFFVRYHLSDVPLSIDPARYRVAVQGRVKAPLSLSLADLKSNFERSEIVAVNQCSGNSRGFFDPRVAGGQLGNGAMANARWTGVRLKDVLAKAGILDGARQVTFNGLDRPAIDATPDFVKTLDIDHALDGEVMIAYAMNGRDLPFLNGYPVRLVVPGFYGTYWVKHLSEITVINDAFDGFWMSKAYRIPDNACACVAPGTKPAATVPINRLNVRSFVTNLRDGQKVKARTTIVRGIAFDGGSGIKEVLVSTDAKRTWTPAKLGPDHGKYAFRPWTIALRFARGGHEIAVRAVNARGQTQPDVPSWNPAGYMRNVVETLRVVAK